MPTVGPGTSARIRCISLPDFASALGSTAKTKTKTPIPPNQWVRLRQKRIPLSKTSTSAITEAPVVVKPETLSNKASVKVGVEPLITKGSAPKRAKTIQQSPTQAKPSLDLSALFLGGRRVRQSPTPKSTAIGIIKGKTDSLYMIEAIRGINIRRPSTFII